MKVWLLCIGVTAKTCVLRLSLLIFRITSTSNPSLKKSIIIRSGEEILISLSKSYEFSTSAEISKPDNDSITARRPIFPIVLLSAIIIDFCIIWNDSR